MVAQQSKPDSVLLKRKPLINSTHHKKTPNAEVALTFSNLNKLPYYQNKRKLRLINKLERRKQWEKVLPLLQDYVNNFGIENFYKNTTLLWRLAQLYEHTGDLNRAKAYYRLVLKHHRADVRRIQQYYDSLEVNTKSLYVPLKHYYELVEYRKALNTLQPPKGVYTNMGEAVNSKYEDYGPVITSGQDQIIFSSKRERRKDINNTPNEDLFYATKKTVTGKRPNLLASPSIAFIMKAPLAFPKTDKPYIFPAANARIAIATVIYL